MLIAWFEKKRLTTESKCISIFPLACHYQPFTVNENLLCSACYFGIFLQFSHHSFLPARTIGHVITAVKIPVRARKSSKWRLYTDFTRARLTQIHSVRQTEPEIMDNLAESAQEVANIMVFKYCLNRQILWAGSKQPDSSCLGQDMRDWNELPPWPRDPFL